MILIIAFNLDEQQKISTLCVMDGISDAIYDHFSKEELDMHITYQATFTTKCKEHYLQFTAILLRC